MKMIEIDNISYKKLSEILTIKNGKDYKSHSKGNVPVYGSGGIISYIDTAVYDKPSVLIPRKGSLDKLYFVDTPFWNVDTIFYTEINTKLVEPRYLYHYLKQAHLEKLNKAGGVPSLTQAVLNNLTIPLPPLPIQQEIVRILDTFTNLTAELTAELTARRKQYEYYRDELLTFGEDVPKLCLSEIATEMYRGSGIKRDEVSESGIPCVRYGEIYTTYDVQFNKCVSHVDPKKVSAPKYFEYGDVLFAITGESVSDIAKSVVYLGSDICLAGGDIVVMKHKQNPRYMAYALSTTNAQIQKSKGKVKSKVVHSSMPSLREIRIPIPSLIEQEKIANILDNFRKLCNGFDEGLPAEISARQKQYEYYRNKLLQFSV